MFFQKKQSLSKEKKSNPSTSFKENLKSHKSFKTNISLLKEKQFRFYKPFQEKSKKEPSKSPNENNFKKKNTASKPTKQPLVSTLNQIFNMNVNQKINVFSENSQNNFKTQDKLYEFLTKQNVENSNSFLCKSLDELQRQNIFFEKNIKKSYLKSDFREKINSKNNKKKSGIAKSKSPPSKKKSLKTNTCSPEGKYPLNSNERQSPLLNLSQISAKLDQINRENSSLSIKIVVDISKFLIMEMAYHSKKLFPILPKLLNVIEKIHKKNNKNQGNSDKKNDKNTDICCEISKKIEELSKEIDFYKEKSNKFINLFQKLIEKGINAPKLLENEINNFFPNEKNIFELEIASQSNDGAAEMSNRSIFYNKNQMDNFQDKIDPFLKNKLKLDLTNLPTLNSKNEEKTIKINKANNKKIMNLFYKPEKKNKLDDSFNNSILGKK